MSSSTTLAPTTRGLTQQEDSGGGSDSGLDNQTVIILVGAVAGAVLVVAIAMYVVVRTWKKTNDPVMLQRAASNRLKRETRNSFRWDPEEHSAKRPLPQAELADAHAVLTLNADEDDSTASRGGYEAFDLCQHGDAQADDNSSISGASEADDAASSPEGEDRDSYIRGELVEVPRRASRRGSTLLYDVQQRRTNQSSANEETVITDLDNEIELIGASGTSAPSALNSDEPNSASLVLSV